MDKLNAAQIDALHSVRHNSLPTLMGPASPDGRTMVALHRRGLVALKEVGIPPWVRETWVITERGRDVLSEHLAEMRGREST